MILQGGPLRFYDTWSYDKPQKHGRKQMGITGVITLLIEVITPFKTGWGPRCMNDSEILLEIPVEIWVFPKIEVPPNPPLKNRVWNHYFHHAFWGVKTTPIFGSTPI